MTTLKNNVSQLIEKCLILGDNMQSLRVVNKSSYPGYGEINFLADRENDYVSVSGIIEQLEEMISEDKEEKKDLTNDLKNIKEAMKVVADKIEERKIYIKNLTLENQKKIEAQIQALEAEVNTYTQVDKLALFRINMNNMSLELKTKVINRLEELGFYFAREIFDFCVFVGEVENERKVQNVKKHLLRKIEIKVPEIINFKSGTNGVRISDISNFIYYLH